jgi:hypothetical protein
VHYSSVIADADNSASVSVTLARRISTGQAQEMQKSSRWSLAIGRWLVAVCLRPFTVFPEFAKEGRR